MFRIVFVCSTPNGDKGRLADALTEATRPSRVCARAAEPGAQIRAETGIENAVRLIKNKVGSGRGQDRPAQGGEYDA